MSAVSANRRNGVAASASPRWSSLQDFLYHLRGVNQGRTALTRMPSGVRWSSAAFLEP